MVGSPGIAGDGLLGLRRRFPKPKVWALRPEENLQTVELHMSPISSMEYGIVGIGFNGLAKLVNFGGHGVKNVTLQSTVKGQEVDVLGFFGTVGKELLTGL